MKKEEKFDRNILFTYVQTKYNIVKLPKQFFIKMSNIFSGKLNGLAKPIPPEHMYDMWVRKSSYLDKLYSNNISKGKKMDSYVRLNYDLAILLSKYEDYLSFLDKQKAQTTVNTNIQENITKTNILYQNIKINNNNNQNDLSDIIDELI
jgi:hypothetical protein